MRDPYSSAAQGLETGFGLGLKADELAESRRRNAFQEGRQTLADQRADEDLKLRQKRETAAEDRDKSLFGLKALGLAGAQFNQRKTELAQAAGATPMGQPVPPGIADEYADVSGQAAQVNQRMANIASRLSTGDITLDQVPPADRHQMILSATGFAPEEAPQVMGAIKDFNSGMSTQNWGLVTQSMNILMKPKLQRSWGAPSAHGGTIDHTEVIGLDPSPNDPNKVIPRLRVYTSLEDRDGNKLYYDAPMTKNGTADPNDPVQTIDVKHGMDWLGNLGVAMQAVQNPQVAGMFTEGAAANADRANNWRAELNARARQYQPKEGIDQQWINTVHRFVDENPTMFEGKPQEKFKQAAQFLRENGAPRNQGVGAATYESKLAEINRQEQAGEIDPDEATAQRKALTTGAKPASALDQERAKTEQAKQGLFGARMSAILAGGTGRAGGKVGGTGGKGAEPTLNDKTLDFMADQFRAGDKSVMTNLGRGAQGAANVVALRQRIADRALAAGDSPRDVALAMQEFMGMGAAQRALGTRAANFGLAKSEAYEMADLVTQASKDYSRTQFQPINKALNSFETNTGDTKVREFGAAINSFINAYARAISPIGAVTVSDKEHARQLLSTADSHDQVIAIIGQLKKEMTAAGNAPGVVKQQLREGFGAGSAPAGGTPAPAAPAKGAAPPVPAGFTVLQ